MAITIVTPATNTQLTTLSIVKEELGITTTTNDTILTRIIDEASDFIVNYTGRKYILERVKETVASEGEQILLLSRTPVRTLYGVKFQTKTVSMTDISIYDQDVGLIYRQTPFTSTMPIGRYINLYPLEYGKLDWEIEYDGGFDAVDASSPSFPLPKEIIRACTDIVKYWYLNRKTDNSVVSRKLGEASETRIQYNTTDLPARTNIILDRWKRTR